MIILTFLSEINVETHVIKKCPLDYLLESVAFCIGSEIRDFFKNKQNSVFYKANFYFGNKTIKIICYCSKDFKKTFNNFTKKCYILKNLKFKHEIKFRI